MPTESMAQALRYLRFTAFAFFLPFIAQASTLINFELFTDGQQLTSQIPAITFQNAVVLSAGISLNDFEFPPRSGSNVLSDDGGPIDINFLVPVDSFGSYFTYLQPLTLTAYNVAGGVLGFAVSQFTNNLAFSGDQNSSPNELISLAFASGISRVVVAGNSSGESFTLDDAQIGDPVVSTNVPEPGSFALTGLFSGCVLLAAIFRISRSPLSRRLKGIPFLRGINA